jgi:hypothetical protein
MYAKVDRTLSNHDVIEKVVRLPFSTPLFSNFFLIQRETTAQFQPRVQQNASLRRRKESENICGQN